jgi:hypothetical protein
VHAGGEFRAAVLVVVAAVELLPSVSSKFRGDLDVAYCIEVAIERSSIERSSK